MPYHPDHDDRPPVLREINEYERLVAGLEEEVAGFRATSEPSIKVSDLAPLLAAMDAYVAAPSKDLMERLRELRAERARVEEKMAVAMEKADQ
jgi:hypothetical protein